ncbi:MAG: FAD-containing oxidoreductase, partial [Caldilineaceae bacterium]|nr:FAD-containing oxidoreductase [Caldilineaceae bacterium]
KKGVTVQETLQTTNPNIYAAGDIAFKYQFTHTADATARMVLQNALFPGPKKKLGDLIVPWATYTSPEVAHVGLYEHDAKEQGIAVQTIVQSIGDTDRGRADGETNGFVKVHVKKGTDKILGATIVASHAGDLISEITLAMNAGVGLKTIGNTIHPYPTQAEAIRKVADAYNRTRLTPLVHGLFKRWLAWTR